MSQLRKKDVKALMETTQEMDAELSVAFTDFEEWAERHKDNGAVVIRCMLHSENRVAVLERTLGTPEMLKEIADLIVNDEHDVMYDVIRKVFDNEGNFDN